MTTNKSTNTSNNAAALLWIALLTAASSLTTWALACSTPFAALAALAAVHMRRQDGLMLVGLAWMASQIVGFTLHDYPHDPRTIAWGFGIGAAAVVSAAAAQAVLARVGDRPLAVRLSAGFVAAFVGYNAGLALCALVLGGISTTLDPANLMRQFLRNGAILIGLYALFRTLLAIGLPAPGAKTVAA